VHINKRGARTAQVIFDLPNNKAEILWRDLETLEYAHNFNTEPRMPTAKEKEEARMAELKKRFSGQITQKKQTQYAIHTTIAGQLWDLDATELCSYFSLGSTVRETVSALPLPPQAVLMPPRAAHQAVIISEDPEPPIEPKPKTQVCLFLGCSILHS